MHFSRSTAGLNLKLHRLFSEGGVRLDDGSAAMEGRFRGSGSRVLGTG